MLPLNSVPALFVFGLCVVAAFLGHILGERDHKGASRVPFAVMFIVIVVLVFCWPVFYPVIASHLHVTLPPLLSYLGKP